MDSLQYAESEMVKQNIQFRYIPLPDMAENNQIETKLHLYKKGKTKYII